MNKFNVEVILINLQDDYKRMSTTVNQLSKKFRKMERTVYSKIHTLSEQIPSKEPSVNSKNKEKDDRIEDLINANSSLKHQVNILNSEIDNKNKMIKQLMDQKTTMNQEMLNREKAISELKIQLGKKDIELKMLQEKTENNQVNKLKDESYQIKLENSSLHSSLEKAEVENQKLIDTLMHRDKELREIEIMNASLSGEIQTLKLKIECLQNEEDILNQNVNFYQSLLKSLDIKNPENNENGNQDNSSTNESDKNTVHVIGDSLLQHIKPEWLLNNDIKENENIRCVKHWAAKLSDCLPVLSKITHSKCIILHVGTNDFKNSSSDDMLNMMDQIINKCEHITENIIISSVIPRYDSHDRFLRQSNLLTNAFISLFSTEVTQF